MNNLELNQYDSQKIHLVYEQWPEIAQKSYNIEQKIEDFEGIDHLVFAGMGGSGAIGDMFSSLLSKTVYTSSG